MARLFSVALLSIALAVPAAAQTVNSGGWRIREIPAIEPPAWRMPGTDVGQNGRFGLGIFGLKPDRLPQRPVTGREMLTPKQRRAGVGLSLKF